MPRSSLRRISRSRRPITRDGTEVTVIFNGTNAPRLHRRGSAGTQSTARFRQAIRGGAGTSRSSDAAFAVENEPPLGGQSESGGPVGNVVSIHALASHLQHAGNVVQVFLRSTFPVVLHFLTMTSSGDANHAENAGPPGSRTPRLNRDALNGVIAGIITSTFSPDAGWMMLNWKCRFTASLAASGEQ